MITFEGETAAWSACFLAALASLPDRTEREDHDDVAGEAESRADAAVRLLDRRAKARAAARDAELKTAQEKVRAQNTYRRVHGYGDPPGYEAEVWTLSEIAGNMATLSRPLRPGEREPLYAASMVARPAMAPGFETGANVFALAACTVDAPAEDTGFMPWTTPVEGAAS